MKNPIFQVTIAGFEINLNVDSRNKFAVQYGKQVKEGLSYTSAAHELGECIFHALACEGKLD